MWFSKMSGRALPSPARRAYRFALPGLGSKGCAVMAWGGRAQAAATTRASSGVRRTSPPDKGTGEPANYGPGRRGASPPGSVHRDRRLAGLALARRLQQRAADPLPPPNDRGTEVAHDGEGGVGREPRDRVAGERIARRVTQQDD